LTSTIRVKRRNTGASGPPSSLAASEIAYNEIDQTLYYGFGNSSGQAASIIPIAGSGSFLKSSDVPSDGKTYGMVSGTWARVVSCSGDTINGNLNLTAQSPTIQFNKSAGAYSNFINGNATNVMRWQVLLGNSEAETGGNIGTNFAIYRFADSGAYLGAPLTILRSDGTLHCGSEMLTNPSAAIQTGGSAGALTVLGPNGGNAAMSFNIVNTFAANFGLGTDGNFYFGGWAHGANTLYKLWSTRDFNYAPVNKGGDTMTGDLGINKATPRIILTKASSGQEIYIDGATAGANRWRIDLATVTAETGGNVGSDFAIQNFNDGGNYMSNALLLERSTGNLTVNSANAYKATAGGWLAYSDARIKNIVGDYQTGLAAIQSLRPVRYTYKGNETADAVDADAQAPYPKSPHYQMAKDGTECIGLIAQECEGAIPEMISERKAFIDGIEAADLRDIDITPVIYALINAVKELSGRVKELTAQVEELKRG
jgi:hypothetical protein